MMLIGHVVDLDVMQGAERQADGEDSARIRGMQVHFAHPLLADHEQGITQRFEACF